MKQVESGSWLEWKSCSYTGNVFNLHLLCVGLFKKASWKPRAETCYRGYCMNPHLALPNLWLAPCVWTGSGTGIMTHRNLCCSPDFQTTVSAKNQLPPAHVINVILAATEVRIFQRAKLYLNWAILNKQLNNFQFFNSRLFFFVETMFIQYTVKADLLL